MKKQTGVVKMIEQHRNARTDSALFVHHLKKELKLMMCVRRVKTLKSEGEARICDMDREELEDQELWKQIEFHL